MKREKLEVKDKKIKKDGGDDTAISCARKGGIMDTGDSRRHRKLDVWKMSMEFVREIYQTSDSFPRAEAYGLTSQMRRSAISIPSNLAEGAARKETKEFGQFLNIAQGSISELDTQIELAMMLNYLDKDRYDNLGKKLNAISKMLYGLARSLKS